MDDREDTDRSVYAGKPLTGRHFTITPEFVERYCVGVDRHNPWYRSDSPYGQPIAPAAIFYWSPARLRGWSVEGAQRVLNSAQDWTFSKPAFVGATLNLSGYVRDRYVLGDRDYVVHEMMAIDEAGDEVCRGAQTTSWLADERLTPNDLPRREDNLSPTAVAEYGIELRTVTITYEMCVGNEGTRPDLHNSREVAQRFGYPEAVVAGPHLLTLCSEALTEVFGTRWLETGALSMQFRRPVFANETITLKATTGAVNVRNGHATATLPIGGVGSDNRVRFVGEASAAA